MFLIISEENPVCPKCGKPLVLRDHKKRIHKRAGGIKEWYMIPRMECRNEKCLCRIHSCIPDDLLPNKHYDAGLIEDVIEGVQSEDDPDTEDYPCADTMKNWREWVSRNKTNIDGQMRSVGYRLLEFSKEFLSSWSSLLEGLRDKISPGWLKEVHAFIYNTGGRITPLGSLP